VTMGGLVRSMQEAWEVPRDLMLGRYPEFVTGGPLPRGQVPVFVFHGLEPQTFERKLRHLADNGYVTLSAEEYFQVLMGARAPSERAVVLTFDDGRGSLWTVAGPLLRRYGMKGIVFVIPGRVPEVGGPPRPTLDDVEAGRVPLSAIAARDEGDEAFLSWQEIEALARSGLFDFQSHTLLHARIHTGPSLAGFVTPGSRRGYAALDTPLVREGDRDLMGADLALGTPLLRSAPRTSEALRFLEDPGPRRACVDAVSREGEAFFADPEWERRLRQILGRQRFTGRTETANDRARAIHSELADARFLLEEHIGKPVVHLCYPWHVAGPTARQLAREAGYRTAFCGKVAGVPITPPGGDPHAIARIGEDYVELLPGRGRADLARVLYRKWARRFARTAS
jgi:peptidoglycan/xylan/chitin deacetylase (PgdA/CDA1 family)